MTSLDQMLSSTGSKIAQMSEEFEKHREKLPFDFKTMAKELKKTKQNLSQVLGREKVLLFDDRLLSSILSYIEDIKKTTPKDEKVRVRRSQKVIFLDELIELQGVLTILQSKKKKEPPAQIKTKSVIKIKGIKSKGSAVPDQDLDKHLSLAESKLNALKKSMSKSGVKINPTQYKELTTILKKTNVSLVKVKALQKSLSGKYKPDYDKKIIQKIFQEINFFEDLIDDEVRVGTAQKQVNLFWDSLKEFQTLLQDLESLKKTRGKAVASVQTDMAR
jgi:hypothetical protein